MTHSLGVMQSGGFRPTVLNGALDTFGRLRVSQPETVFDSQQIVDSQPLFWDDAEVSGGGTSSAFVTNQAATRISVGNLTAGERVRQTKRSLHYQPGKGQLIFTTFVMGAAATGITRAVGQFDAQNGLFLRQISTGPAFVRRSFTSGVTADDVVPQASWNVDRLDGTGPSGFVLDLTKSQILAIGYEWLGVGSVVLGFVIDAKFIVAHTMQHANVLSVVYMSLPDLPLRYSIANDGTGPAASFDHICSTVISEGGQQPTGFPYGVDRTTALTTLNDQDFYPLIAMRLRAGYTYAEVVPSGISVVATANAEFSWRLLLNPTVAGVAFAWTTPETTSAVEVDIARVNTTKVSGGTVLKAGVAAANTAIEDIALPPEFALGVSIAGVSDTLVLAVSRLSGTAEPFFGALNWRESR